MEFNPTGIFAIAAVGAAMFAVAGKRAGQSWWAWAIGGLLIGLTVGTITVGLAHSVALPYSSAETRSKFIVGAALALLIMAPMSWLVVCRSRAR